jgi:hypothetical protein
MNLVFYRVLIIWWKKVLILRSFPWCFEVIAPVWFATRVFLKFPFSGFHLLIHVMLRVWHGENTHNGNDVEWNDHFSSVSQTGRCVGREW